MYVKKYQQCFLFFKFLLQKFLHISVKMWKKGYPWTYNVTLKGAEFGYNNMETPDIAGDVTFKIAAAKLGDANGDKESDIADAVSIVNHVVGKPNVKFIGVAADANGDGEIDITDAVHIVNLVVGKIPALVPSNENTLPEPE